ncbi:MAG TPA: cation:proton antiporter [Candidatus Rubrimentiphilum sp.]|nr:cation:proton antiporter [Candidatus Rubrimentiphilum sp.]
MQLGLVAALLIAGIIVGVIFPGRLTGVFGAATLYVFLPALIYEGAWRLESRTMRRMWGPILVLAVPGVVCTAAIVALCVHYIGSVGWIPALLLGAILSATDPVAVLAIFRRLRLPPSLLTIVESEALLNDAVAVVIFRGVAAAAALSATAGLWQVTAHAALGAFLGIVCGAAIGGAAAALLGRTRQFVAYGVATLAGAYGAYYLATHFDWSGIFAVLAFGITLRLLQQRRLDAACSESVGRFWEGIALIANAALFFLIGSAIDITHIGPALPISLLTAVIVLASRFAIVHGLLEFSRPRLHLAWLTVVRMAGIRGALSLALALAIPQGVAGRELVVNVTFVVVVVTLLVGLLTLERRVTKLPLEAR